MYEKFAWIPAVFAVVVATGCGGSHLKEQVEAPTATAAQVLSFGGLVASFMLPWAALASDFSTYLHPKAQITGKKLWSNPRIDDTWTTEADDHSSDLAWSCAHKNA